MRGAIGLALLGWVAGCTSGGTMSAGADGATGSAQPDGDGTSSSTDGPPAADLGASGDGAIAPGAIDWTPFSLQEPDGQTQTKLAGYHDAYFYANGSYQAFMDTMTGTTTSGSLHPRCELRESATWLASGTNTLKVTGHVAMLGGGATGKTTVGQVFNADGSIPLAELIYLGDGTFEVLYEEAKGGGSYTKTTATAALGADYTFVLSLSSGQLVISIDNTAVFTMKPSAAVSGNHFYFKAGDYDQTATSGATSTVPYSLVENSTIQIVHQ
jgi:hypothetical protein